MSDSLLRMRLFVAVYEDRSFTAAAQREHGTQSGVSQHISKLEDQLGVKLFVRVGNNILPTPAGDSYYQGCIKVLQMHEQTNRAIRAFGSGLDGEVVVGITPTLARASLAAALARFIALHPNVVIRVLEAYSDVITDKVRSGELSFAVVPGVKEELGIRSTPFTSTPELFVCGRASGRILPAAVRMADLGPLKIVLPSSAQMRRNNVEHYLIATGAQIERRLEIDTMSGTLAFIARTDWVAILPSIMMATERDNDLFDMRPLTDPSLALDLFVIQQTRQSMSLAAASFLDLLREETAALAHEKS